MSLYDEDRVDHTALVAEVLAMAASSMDWGSGFLSDEEVIALRQLARLVGMDPAEVTPEKWSMSGAVRIENEHALRRDDLWSTGFSLIRSRAVCLCGWVGTWHDRVPAGRYSGPEYEAWRREDDARMNKAMDEGRTHIAERLESAREGTS